jgi:hypothetical protein
MSSKQRSHHQSLKSHPISLYRCENISISRIGLGEIGDHDLDSLFTRLQKSDARSKHRGWLPWLVQAQRKVLHISLSSDLSSRYRTGLPGFSRDGTEKSLTSFTRSCHVSRTYWLLRTLGCAVTTAAPRSRPAHQLAVVWHVPVRGTNRPFRTIRWPGSRTGERSFSR